MNGTELITAERERQINKEKWDSSHDDVLENCELCLFGACYALDVAGKHGKASISWRLDYQETAKRLFPFDMEWWKPTPDDPIKQLTKAGALIAAEIDRLQRVKK